jgi:hypothetical protein
MSEHEIIEVLQACRPVYSNLHDKIQYELSEEEMALLEKFKVTWEDGLFIRWELIEQGGMSQREVAFLGAICITLKRRKSYRSLATFN